MLVLPRAALLVVWTNAWLAGDITMDAVVDRVTRDDEPHEVHALPEADGPVGLGRWLAWIRAAGAHRLLLAMPAPGDPLGLAGPPAFTEAAVESGEAALAVGATGGLVPDVRPFGPPGDLGHQVAWQWHDRAVPAPDLPTLAEAERDLTEALLAATDELTRLDVPSWREAAGDLLSDLRSTAAIDVLPRSLPQRSHALVARALRLSAVVRLALSDDGGATSGAAALARRAALQPLERSVRKALVAGCSAGSAPSDAPILPAHWGSPPSR